MDPMLCFYCRLRRVEIDYKKVVAYIFFENLRVKVMNASFCLRSGKAKPFPQYIFRTFVYARLCGPKNEPVNRPKARSNLISHSEFSIELTEGNVQCIEFNQEFHSSTATALLWPRNQCWDSRCICPLAG